MCILIAVGRWVRENGGGDLKHILFCSLLHQKQFAMLNYPHLHKEGVHLHSCRASSHHMRIQPNSSTQTLFLSFLWVLWRGFWGCWTRQSVNTWMPDLMFQFVFCYSALQPAAKWTVFSPKYLNQLVWSVEDFFSLFVF